MSLNVFFTCKSSKISSHKFSIFLLSVKFKQLKESGKFKFLITKIESYWKNYNKPNKKNKLNLYMKIIIKSQRKIIKKVKIKLNQINQNKTCLMK